MRFTIGPEHEGERVDRAAAALAGIARSQVQNLSDAGLVVINGKPVKASHKLHEGDVLTFTLPEPPSDELIPEDLPIDVLYHDKHLVIVNKPAGMVVYPAAGHPRGTLMNALRHRIGPLAAPGAPLRPGVVHRLDRDTSGVMVVALSEEAYHHLVEQFRERSVTRAYQVLVYGSFAKESGEIEAAIGRADSDRKRMSVHAKRSREARTTWRLLKRLRHASLIEAKLGTGRTHQIRVHFMSVGHPVLGDETYGGKTFLQVRGRKITFPRQMLHAATLGITHPVTGEYLEYSTPMPADMEEAIAALLSAA